MEEKYGELGGGEVYILPQLEEENARLKRLDADLNLDNTILQELIKKDLKPVLRRELAVWNRQTYGLAIDKTCDLTKLSSGGYYRDYQPFLYFYLKTVHKKML